jgi:hypothetical protein
MILGFVSAGLAQVFAIVIRTTPQVEAQAESARSLMGLSIWLPEDLSSTPSAIDDGSGPGGLDVGPVTATGCAGASPGESLLRARWSEQVVLTTVTYYASYRYVQSNGGDAVVRYSCRAGGNAVAATMTGVLVERPECPRPPGARLVEVELVPDAQSAAGGAVFRVHVDCQVTEVRGISNNPHDELAAWSAPTSTIAPATTTTSSAPSTTTTTTAPSTTTSPSTTSTSSTTTVAPSCTSATIVSVDPTPASNGPHDDVAELRKDLVITIGWSGYCPSLGILFDPWAADGTASKNPKWYSMKGATTITLLGRGGELWSDGTHTIRLLNGVNSTAALSSKTVTVT